MYDMLFSPMNIGTVRIKNRIVMTAAEFSLGEPSGKVTPRLSDYYRWWESSTAMERSWRSSCTTPEDKVWQVP